MKIRTNELTGAALDWAVAKCEGLIDQDLVFTNGAVTKAVVVDGNALYDMRYGEDYDPATNWSRGGPIIDRERIALIDNRLTCCATIYPDNNEPVCGFGPTLLIAAMRCYVASKLGDEVEIPEELK